MYLTGGALNPARAFGPGVVIKSFHSYHWIYWVGPYLGGALAAGFYAMNKLLRFEMVNPGQDDDGELSPESAINKALDERLDNNNRGDLQSGSSGSNHGRNMHELTTFPTRASMTQRQRSHGQRSVDQDSREDFGLGRAYNDNGQLRETQRKQASGAHNMV